MSKLEIQLSLPEHIAEALKAFAHHQGISESEMIAGILEGVLGNRLLQPYIKNGKFDAAGWREAMRETGQAIDKWHREHPDEVANLRRAGRAARKRASQQV